uniref:VHS domain-containing protein At3g16270 n=1 Tax=Anthurium amnicola TaxID=1678845 RepID=A0A1D1ZCH7_9ARAE
MDTSRRAVEAYWRSRMVDGVTSDEDKLAPVYKLDEVCELLLASHSSIVKEVADYILKRLDHKSPVVKQKALRLIKYSVGKSGVEFRREMQRHSAVMRQLFHYKGYPDPLKGDALNKAVRDTAHEAVSAIFASDDNKAPPIEGVKKRMEGFGNTNFEMPTEDKKSFLSEVVGLGSASIKQGLNTIAAAHSFRKNDNGTYKSPNLLRSLTTEIDSRDKYEGDDHRERWKSPVASKNMASASWSQDSSGTIDAASTDGGTSSDKSREERLLETIVTPSGVRLQPSRDAIQIFLMEASKLNPTAMSNALELKLKSQLWQVRMKAICVLESILRKKDGACFSTIGSYFTEHRDSVVKCSESPQASLREKAYKVLSLLDGENTSGTNQAEEPPSSKASPASVVPLPDLIDTGEADNYINGDTIHRQSHQSNTDMTAAGSLVDDLFGGEPMPNVGASESRKEDPFSDVSFHATEDRGQSDDLFSGLTVDETKPIKESNNLTSLSTNELGRGNKLSGGALGGASSAATNLDTSSGPSLSPANDALSGIFGSQMLGMSQNAFFPLGSIPYSVPQSIMLNQPFAPQPMINGAMGSFVSQQQLLFQNFGHLDTGIAHAPGNANASPLPDVFQLSNNPVQSHSTMMSSKKEDTRAFDFISDHVSAARNQKRVV